VSGSEIYYPEYPYRAGITRELGEHLQAMASDLVPKLEIGARIVRCRYWIKRRYIAEPVQETRNEGARHRAYEHP